jgi:hypothetical protein
MSPRQAFKFGFLLRCIEDGCTPEDIREKVASLATRTKTASFWGSLKTLGLGAGALALAAPPIAGGLAGYGLAKATDIDDTDVEEAKNQELIQELQRQTDRAIRMRQARDYQKQRQSTGRVFR